MTPNHNTKIDRKALANELAAEIGAEAKYLGIPSCAYQVGPYTINKDNSIDGGDLEAIKTFLIRHDYIHQEPAAPVEESTDTITETDVSIPISELTPIAMINLLKLIYAKQDLIAAMTRSDFIFIDEEVIGLLNDEKPDSMKKVMSIMESEAKVDMIRGLDLKADRLTFAFPDDEKEPANWQSYTKLFLAFIERAKAAQHISAKRVEPAESEMKYYCNSLLTQLGFGGVNFKADRAALLGHLAGYAAFKNTDKMKAHKAKFTERRKAARQTTTVETDGDLKAAGEEVVE